MIPVVLALLAAVLAASVGGGAGAARGRPRTPPCPAAPRRPAGPVPPGGAGAGGRPAATARPPACGAPLRGRPARCARPRGGRRASRRVHRRRRCGPPPRSPTVRSPGTSPTLVAAGRTGRVVGGRARRLATRPPDPGRRAHRGRSRSRCAVRWPAGAPRSTRSPTRSARGWRCAERCGRCRRRPVRRRVVMSVTPLAFAAVAAALDPRVAGLLVGRPLGWACLAAGVAMNGGRRGLDGADRGVVAGRGRRDPRAPSSRRGPAWCWPRGGAPVRAGGRSCRDRPDLARTAGARRPGPGRRAWSWPRS